MTKQKKMPLNSEYGNIDIETLGVSGESGLLNRAIGCSRMLRRGLLVLGLIGFVVYFLTGRTPTADMPEAETLPPSTLALITRAPSATPVARATQKPLPLITRSASTSTPLAAMVVVGQVASTPTSDASERLALAGQLPDLNEVFLVQQSGDDYVVMVSADPQFNTQAYAQTIFDVASKSNPQIVRFAVSIDDGKSALWYSLNTTDKTWTSSKHQPNWVTLADEHKK